MTLRLLLIRHGLSSYNRENRIQGRNDLSNLTEEGLLQAKKAGEALHPLPIQVIYSSPLQRALNTAIEVGKNQKVTLNPIIDNDLLEIDLEPWSGLSVDDVKTKYHDAYRTWKKCPYDLTLLRKNGNRFSPIKELMDQAENFLNKIFVAHDPDENQNVVVVAHNAILRCLILKLLNEPKDGFQRLKLDNSSISILNINKKENHKLDVQIESLNNTAHLNTSLPKKTNNPRIILVRHGETNWNREGRFQGQIDIPLNENGKKQALSAGKALKNVIFQKAFSSSMSRPIETAKLILRDHPSIKIQQREELIEIGHGLWEGKLEEEIIAEWGDLLNQWQTTPEMVQMPNGETINDVSKRALKCWKDICNNLCQNETALVVAHDAVNKTIICHLLGLSTADIWKVKQGNGGITVIDIIQEKDHPDIVICLNYTSHLGGILDNTAQGAL